VDDERPTRIFLVGMMGSGKTTIGQALARRTGWPFFDNDTLVRSLTGREPAMIDSVDGEDALHAVEIAALRKAMAAPGSAVIAVAGAVVDDDAARRDLKATDGHVVWLRGRPETLRARIGAGRGRRADAVDFAWIAARAAEREPRYRAVADQIVDIEDRRPKAIVDAILSEVERAAG